MKEIVLSKGKDVALVDDEDYEWLSQFKWYLLTSGVHTKLKYAFTKSKNDYKAGAVAMHRLIMNAAKGQIVDHKDRDGLNNQRSNLRFASATQNQHNRPGSPLSSSKYKGVYWSDENNGWVASISVDYKNLVLGTFNVEEEAALAYDRKAREVQGEFAFLNFPDVTEYVVKRWLVTYKVAIPSVSRNSGLKRVDLPQEIEASTTFQARLQARNNIRKRSDVVLRCFVSIEEVK